LEFRPGYGCYSLEPLSRGSFFLNICERSPLFNQAIPTLIDYQVV
jgi:hypothetical protein